MFEKIFVGAAFSLLLVQFFINIGMNIGILPIVGVTLPFVSYGGSSLLSNAILLGMVSGIGSFLRRKDVLEIR
jgi:rod shape determining protein RodA